MMSKGLQRAGGWEKFSIDYIVFFSKLKMIKDKIRDFNIKSGNNNIDLKIMGFELNYNSYIPKSSDENIKKKLYLVCSRKR